MKLIVQIPCFNEEATLAATVADIPRRIAGLDRVEILVVDDGSTDRTAQVAREAGVDHVVRHRTNRGLAHAFQTGLEACLERGADVIVNTDADNQYSGADVARLVEPIVAGRADLVVGDRQTATLAHFSRTKRHLQGLGSGVVRTLSGLDIPDAVSGFRALSRRAALGTSIVSTFSYTTEHLIQAGHQRLAVVSVPVGTNRVERESRLFRSIPGFVRSTAATMIRAYTMYQPLRIYSLVGLALFAVGAVPIVRFLYFWVTDGGAGHIQSLVLGGVLLLMGFITFLLGVLAELVSVNRKLTQMVLEKVRRIEAETVGRSGTGAGEPRAGERDP